MGIEEKNKELIYRYYELYNQHKLEAVWELMSPEWHSGDATFEQNKQADIMLSNAFPDLKSTILDMVAEGDKVSYIVNAKGTHTGEPFMGISLTGKKIDITNTWIVRIVDNKIVEHNGTPSFVTGLQQLGVMLTIPEAVKAYNESQQ